ncbi:MULTISPECIES: 23S rRNA (uracil(1939)-C(5))-methyltransferase RlmD [Atopobiaceae]|uniref:23S rRNA m(5)U-1939 methyltransferase n=1 Tax=Parafannyhessea umbonata TaxID=604330 RepID=A0A1H6JHP8_9ACTN|nr:MULTISPECIES: 23S rRNA (uracil(1939)-C(5))-methyltransferase RlmD [Atopobiaceae]SEH58626.1 23S rRNA m(5)U-1939 methyltransferase [Parafannyhessea umbonata]SJZ52139.1 23S rRNA (uracil1939-C5)-methyltransferase [Olsenella sp. KH1P3]
MRLYVERMAYGSDAIAHDKDGKTVFVRGAVPGDTVEATLTQDSKTFSRASVESVLEPSPSRVDSPCPYAAICGGCPWSSMSHEAQTEAKRAGVVNALKRIGHFDADRTEELVRTCESPSDPWGYRNKVELAFAQAGARSIIGMHAADEKTVVRVNDCHLLEKRFSKLPKKVSGAVTYLANSHGLTFDRIGIRASRRTGECEVALWTQPGPFPRAQVAKILGDAANLSSVVRVMTKGPKKARKIVGVERLAGHGNWSEVIGEEKMTVSAPSFFQVNTVGAERLVELVVESLGPQEDDEAMDLYSGAGTFTLPLARRSAFVSAVESYGPAVRDLRRNLEQAHIENVDAVGGDAGREFPDTDADIIVVDPPRAGLAEDVVAQLSEQSARRIAYVSCDPATLARDLERFERAGSYRVKSVSPVDLFPQTFHVENVTILERV